MTSSDYVKPSVLDSPSAVLAGPSNASILQKQSLDAAAATVNTQYLFYGALALGGALLISKLVGKK